ncbi:MAG: phasin family protein [Actinomycetota bacterium]
MATKKDDKDSGDRPGNGGADPAGTAAQAAGQAAEAGRQAAETGHRAAQGATRTAERGVAQIADFGRRSGDQMRGMMTAGARAYRDMTDVSRDDVDALMQSGARLAKGMQDMSMEMMQYTQNSLRIGMRAANDLMGCRSVEDVVQISRDLVRESVETLLHESARLLELSSQVATDAVSPINERVNNAPPQQH